MIKSSSVTKSKSSGGPHTDEDSKFVSRNSLKTGTYSKLAVLPNESQQDFDQLVEQFQKDFYPKDAVEMMLVREMAVITWKKLRLEKLEHDYCSRQLAAQITLEEFLSIDHRFTELMYRFWIDSKALISMELEKVSKMVKYIEPHRRRNVSVAQLKYIKAEFKNLYASILDVYEQARPLATQEPDLEELVAARVREPDGPEKYLIPLCIDKLLPQIQAGLKCAKFRDQIEEGVIQIRQERLLKMMQLGGVQRASDDLNRAMIRTVGEYRKHHEWRIQNRTEQLPTHDSKALPAE
jgi:hypothetical protein